MVEGVLRVEQPQRCHLLAKEVCLPRLCQVKCLPHAACRHQLCNAHVCWRRGQRAGSRATAITALQHQSGGGVRRVHKQQANTTRTPTERVDVIAADLPPNHL